VHGLEVHEIVVPLRFTEYVAPGSWPGAVQLRSIAVVGEVVERVAVTTGVTRLSAFVAPAPVPATDHAAQAAPPPNSTAPTIVATATTVKGLRERRGI
jgi:hypothetical protein